MRQLTLAIAAVLVLQFSYARADTQPEKRQPTPEEMQKLMEATMGSMVPLMGRMVEAMIEGELKMAERPDTADRLAAFKKNLFDALLKKGFTESQALQIVISTGIPTASPGAK